jgi:hypothetical protein
MIKTLKGGTEQMERNFKIGDKLVCINNTGASSLVSLGEIVVVTRDTFKGKSGESVIIVNSKSDKHDLLAERFELADNAKAVGVGIKEENLHIILKDSCRNFVKIATTEKEALSYKVEDDESYTAYKLVAIANLRKSTEVTTIKKK